MELNDRFFKKSVDDAILDLLRTMKTQSADWRSRRAQIVNFIQSHPERFTRVYTEEERDELNQDNATILTILDYIDTNLPEVIE